MQSTFYRIVCKSMFGARAVNPIGEGTYWTPRWDAIIRMANSVYIRYLLDSRSRLHKKECWHTTIYSLSNAAFTDPPKEHAWAFTYCVDAGEQVLVNAYQPPEIIFQGCPDHSEFELLCTETVPEMFDHSKYQAAVETPDGPIYLSPDYLRKKVVGYKKIEWEFVPAITLNNQNEADQFFKAHHLIEPFDPDCGLAYGMNDMWNKTEESAKPNHSPRRRSNRIPFHAGNNA